MLIIWIIKEYFVTKEPQNYFYSVSVTLRAILVVFFIIFRKDSKAEISEKQTV